MYSLMMQFPLSRSHGRENKNLGIRIKIARLHEKIYDSIFGEENFYKRIPIIFLLSTIIHPVE